jgi:hypothetical protein
MFLDTGNSTQLGEFFRTWEFLNPNPTQAPYSLLLYRTAMDSRLLAS